MGLTTRAYPQPVPIAAHHRLSEFGCGNPALDNWLVAHALNNEGKASRTYVVLAPTNVVLAYYCLAAGSITRGDLPGRLRHGLPDPVPVMILGRLAVDRDHAGNGLGPQLVREALRRTAQAADIAGVRGLLVHAIDEQAAGFYTKYGFQAFVTGTRTLFLQIETIVESLQLKTRNLLPPCPA